MGSSQCRLLNYVIQKSKQSNSEKGIQLNIVRTKVSLQCVLESCKKFEGEGLCLFWLFQPYLFVFGEEAFKILSNENTAVNKPYQFDLFKEVVMNSLLTSGGSLWRKRRKMLNPVFYASNLKDKTQFINRNTKLLVKNLRKDNTQPSIDILKYLKVCTFRSIYEFVTDQEFVANEKNLQREKDIIDTVNMGSEMISSRILKPWLHPKCFMNFSRKGRWFLQKKENSCKHIQKMLDDMQESFLQNKVGNDAETDEFCRSSRRSFRQVIIEKHVKDPTYTSIDMLGELNGLFIAGYDTVATALMWNLFLLGHHSEIQEHVYEEVESVIGHNNEVSYEDLENLKYLECVIKESLRIYPPVPFHMRRTGKDVQCGKYTVPKGTNIVFCSLLAHKDPNMFPDPEKFDPDRFLVENADKKLITYSFAEGVRNCIGKKFAMMEMKIILAHVIKNFKVTSIDRREDITLSWEIVLTTVKPLRICLTPRQQNSIQE